MSRPIKTLLFVFLLSIIVLSLVSLIMTPDIRRKRDEKKQKLELLNHYQTLLLRKTDLESRWAQVKNDFVGVGTPPEEIQNRWQKALVAAAESEALKIEKLEPAGFKDGEISVYLSVAGEIKPFFRFLYQLIQTDPLAEVTALTIHSEEGTPLFAFELVLGKGVS